MTITPSHLICPPNHILPITYFNPPFSIKNKERVNIDILTAYRPKNRNANIQNSDKLIFIRKMGGWLLSEIIPGNP